MTSTYYEFKSDQIRKHLCCELLSVTKFVTFGLCDQVKAYDQVKAFAQLP